MLSRGGRSICTTMIDIRNDRSPGVDDDHLSIGRWIDRCNRMQSIGCVRKVSAVCTSSAGALVGGHQREIIIPVER